MNLQLIKEQCSCPERWVFDKNTHYAVSSKGYLKNTQTGRVILGNWHNQGYRRAYLEVLGSKRNYYIHRLVARAFLTNPEKLETVDHINGIKHHNCVCNLQWMTADDNKRKHNLREYIVTSPAGVEYQVDDIRAFCEEQGLGPNNLRNTATGLRAHHKGWVARFK